MVSVELGMLPTEKFLALYGLSGGGGSSTIKGIILGWPDGLNVQDIGNFGRETCCKAAT